MNELRKVFSKYDDEIVRHQYRNFYPTSTMNFNAVNKKTVFKIDLDDEFISKNIQYFIAGEYKSKDSTKAYTGNENVKMVDNFVASLFSQIEVKKHNTLIDETEYPSVVSTVKGCVSSPGAHVYNGNSMKSGLKSLFKGGGDFCAVGYLGDLGLGFFDDVNIPIYKGGFEITFTRNGDDNVLYRFSTSGNAVIPEEGKVEITAFYLKVPIIEYTSETKINLIKEISESDYKFQFKNWQCIQHSKVSGKSLTFDVTNIYRNVDNPVWAFVVFQKNRENNQLKDNTKFDHSDVRNIWMEIGGKRYPEEPWDIDWNGYNFMPAYEAFDDFKKVFITDQNTVPFVYPDIFKDSYPIFSIDLSRQPQNISNTKSNIILHVDFNNNIATPSGSNEGTICYVVILSNMMFTYSPARNMIQQEI